MLTSRYELKLRFPWRPETFNALLFGCWHAFIILKIYKVQVSFCLIISQGLTENIVGNFSRIDRHQLTIGYCSNLHKTLWPQRYFYSKSINIDVSMHVLYVDKKLIPCLIKMMSSLLYSRLVSLSFRIIECKAQI